MSLSVDIPPPTTSSAYPPPPTSPFFDRSQPITPTLSVRSGGSNSAGPHRSSRHDLLHHHQHRQQAPASVPAPVKCLSIVPRMTSTDPPFSLGHAALALKDKILVCGGILGAGDSFHSCTRSFGKYNPFVHCYDNTVHRWVLLNARFPFPREGHTFVRYKDKAYIHGGFGPGGLSRTLLNETKATSRTRSRESAQPQQPFLPVGYLQDTIELNLNNANFVEVETFAPDSEPTQYRCSHAAAVMGAQMYIFGGCGIKVTETLSVAALADGNERVTSDYTIDEIVRNDLVRFDMERMCWVRVLSAEDVDEYHDEGVMIPSPCWGHGLTADPATRSLIMFGGRDEEHCFGNLFVFDTSAKEWRLPELIGDAPKPRFSHQQVLWERFLLVLGGRTDLTGTSLFPISGGGVRRADGPTIDFTTNDPTQTVLHVLCLESLIWHRVSLGHSVPKGLWGSTIVPMSDRARHRREITRSQRHVDSSNFTTHHHNNNKSDRSDANNNYSNTSSAYDFSLFLRNNNTNNNNHNSSNINKKFARLPQRSHPSRQSYDVQLIVIGGSSSVAHNPPLRSAAAAATAPTSLTDFADEALQRSKMCYISTESEKCVGMHVVSLALQNDEKNNSNQWGNASNDDGDGSNVGDASQQKKPRQHASPSPSRTDATNLSFSPKAKKVTAAELPGMVERLQRPARREDVMQEHAEEREKEEAAKRIPHKKLTKEEQDAIIHRQYTTSLQHVLEHRTELFRKYTHHHPGKAEGSGSSGSIKSNKAKKTTGAEAATQYYKASLEHAHQTRERLAEKYLSEPTHVILPKKRIAQSSERLCAGGLKSRDDARSISRQKYAPDVASKHLTKSESDALIGRLYTPATPPKRPHQL